MAASTATYTVFVIMPFDDYFQPVYDQLIDAPLTELGLHVTRGDTNLNAQNILRDVVTGIATADLVVADLTRLNPNVLYELGIAHGLNKKTILISQTLDDIPFDLKSYRFVHYSDHFAEAKKLSGKLTDIAQGFLEGSSQFGNPVSDYLGVEPGRPAPQSPSITPELRGEEKKRAEAVVQAKDKGILDWIAEIDSSAGAVGESAGRIGDRTKRLGADMEGKGAALAAESTSGTPGSAVRVQSIVNDAASDLRAYADDIENEVPVFSSEWKRFSENTLALLTSSVSLSEEQRKQLHAVRPQLVALQKGLASAIASLRPLRDMIQNLENMKLSYDLSQGAYRTVQVLESLLGELEAASASSSRMVELLPRATRVTQSAKRRPSQADRKRK